MISFGIYKNLIEFHWIMYPLVILIPLWLVNTRVLAGRIRDVETDRFFPSVLLLTLITYLMLVPIVFIFFIGPAGMGSNIIIKILLFGGFLIPPLNQVLHIALFKFKQHCGAKVGYWGSKRVVNILGILACIMGVVLVIGFIDMYCVEPYWIQVNTYKLTMDRLQSSKPITMMQITDLHFEADREFHFRHSTQGILDIMDRQTPDLIFMTGDYVHDRSFGKYQAFLEKLSAPYGVYAVSGNFSSLDTELFSTAANITVLKDNWTGVTIGKTNLAIIGIDFHTTGKAGRVIAETPESATRILLCHTPDVLLDLGGERVDLILSGHTHGGQVCIPGFGAVITLTKLGVRYASGLFSEKSGYLYVNRGIGCEPGDIPKIRFFCRPEIAMFRLRQGVANSSQNRPPP